MAHFEIIVGSVLGATEYVADEVLATLEQHGHSGSIHLQPQLSDISKDNAWIICTSTHGAGDLPDNIEPFAATLQHESLNGVQYLVIGLGDSSYDTYCFGAMTMQKLCDKQGASLLAEPLHIDVLNHPIPEEKAVEWLSDWLKNEVIA